MEGLKLELETLEYAGLLRELAPDLGGTEPRLLVKGREIVNLASNNFLGLARHPKVIGAAWEALSCYGVGSCSSRLIAGTTDAHRMLEERLASFLGTERALVFSSGYLANIGLLSALMEKGDLVLSDELNHASIVDGCRLSRAQVRVYPHGDSDYAERILRTSRARRRLLVTEGLFSMDGDIPPLKELSEVARSHSAWLLVDEAHSIGVLGTGGRGIVDALGLADSVPIRMGTLGKAFGCFGAFVAGTKELIGLLINKCRPFIFTTGLPPHLCAAALAAMELIEAGDDLRSRLKENSDSLRVGLRAMGFDTFHSENHIVPVFTGDAPTTVAMSRSLLAHGVRAPAVRPPTVPAGAGRLRCALMATHSRADLKFALAAFAKLGETA